MSFTIETYGISCMRNNTLVRTYDKRRSRKHSFLGRLNHHRLTFRAQKPDPGPLFKTHAHATSDPPGARIFAQADKQFSIASTLQNARGAHVHWYLCWLPNMKAGNHTFAITNKPLWLALLKRPDRGQELSSTACQTHQATQCEPQAWKNRLMGDNALLVKRRQQPMQLDTRRGITSVGRKRSLAPLSSPNRTVMHNVLKILHSPTTANTQMPTSKTAMA
eukprot:4657784-Amphidinium_carterae.1